MVQMCRRPIPLSLAQCTEVARRRKLRVPAQHQRTLCWDTPEPHLFFYDDDETETLGITSNDGKELSGSTRGDPRPPQTGLSHQTSRQRAITSNTRRPLSHQLDVVENEYYSGKK